MSPVWRLGQERRRRRLLGYWVCAPGNATISLYYSVLEMPVVMWFPKSDKSWTKSLALVLETALPVLV